MFDVVIFSLFLHSCWPRAVRPFVEFKQELATLENASSQTFGSQGKLTFGLQQLHTKSMNDSDSIVCH